MFSSARMSTQILATTVVSLGLLTLGACEKVKPAEELARYQKAMAIIDSNPQDLSKITEAQLALNKLLAEKEKSALAHAGLIRVEVEGAKNSSEELRGEYFTRGNASLKAALALDPENTEAHIWGAELASLAGDNEKAANLVGKALSKSPNDLRAMLVDAQVKAGSDNLDGAIDAAEAALNSTSDPAMQAKVHRVLGPLFEKKGNLSAAALSKEALVKANPDLISLRVEHAALLVKKGDFDKAIEAAEAAIKIKDTPEAHQVLAQAAAKKGIQLFLKKHVDDASKSFELATMHDEKNADAWYGLALVQREEARKEKSVDLLETSGKNLEKALSLDPSHSDARDELKKHQEFIDQLSQESQTFKRRRRRRR